MKTFIMTKDQLDATLANGRWFAGFRYRWKKLSDGTYRVTTNYVIAELSHA